MLYNVVIDKEIANDRDALVANLYTFLRSYVPKRLIYETLDNKEDCIQDTIIFILNRYDELVTELEKEAEDYRDRFNYEKYFYNRARSYISYWIRRINKERKQARDYIDNAIYLKQYQSEFNYSPIDYTILDKILNEYNLAPETKQNLGRISEAMLVDIGYTSTDKYENNNHEVNETTLEKIAYAVVDEYLIESVRYGTLWQKKR